MYDVELDFFGVVFIGFIIFFFVGGLDFKINRCMFYVSIFEFKDGFWFVG